MMASASTRASTSCEGVSAGRSAGGTGELHALFAFEFFGQGFANDVGQADESPIRDGLSGGALLRRHEHRDALKLTRRAFGRHRATPSAQAFRWVVKRYGESA